MHSKSILLLFSIFLGTAAELAAQSLLTERMEVGVHAGASHYIGEINPGIMGAQPFSAGLSGKYYFNPMSHVDRTWGLRLDANFTRIAGDDADSDNVVRRNRGLNFTNKIIELAALAEFQFYNYRATRVTHLFTPYVFAGIGGIYHNPKADVPSGTGRVSYAFAIPFGAGVKLNLRGPWTVGLELNYRYVFSDFIDGIGSKEHLGYTALANPKAAAAGNYSSVIGTQRGDDGNDFFMTTVLKVSYTLYKYRDPSWK